MKLQDNYPYMLRNDGECFCVKDIDIHPYILPPNSACDDKKDIEALFEEYSDSLDWYYEHTKQPSVKRDIGILIKSVVEWYTKNDFSPPGYWLDGESSIKASYDFFGVTEDTPIYSDSIWSICDLVDDLNYRVNQEFCRVRTSDMYSDFGGTNDGCIYFRISSNRFNWFDLIWQLVYDNRKDYESVTIVRDEDTKHPYKINGELIDHYPIKDFITLKGRPVVERKMKRTRYYLQLDESILNEDIEAVRKQYPKISDEIFNKLIAFDPTFNKDRNSVGTYGKWILNGYNKGLITDKDFGHLKDVLTRFEDNKKNLKEKDIGKFKTVQDLDDMLNNDDSYKELSHRQEVRQRQKDRKNADLGNEAELVYEDGDWEVWIPKTYAASCKLGQGASWCTASTESDYYYNHYKDTYGGDYYININKHNPEEKYQFHFESGQFMDKDDRSVDLKDFFEENKGLRDFYLPTIAESVGIDLNDEYTEVQLDWLDFDIEYQHAHQYDRESLSGSCIRACVSDFRYGSGELDSQFELYGGVNSADLVNALENLSQKQSDMVEKYTGYTVGELINLCEEEDEDITWCVRQAYEYAYAQGCANDCLDDFKSSLNNCYQPGLFKCDFERENIVVEYDTETLIFNLFEYDGDYLKNNADVAKQSIVWQSFMEEFDFTEPRYGWSGFDEDGFVDSLIDELPELNAV